MKYAALVVVCTGVWAQSLQVSPSTATRGALNSFLIKINSPSGKEPVALQWTLRVADGITITTRDVRAGSAAESADKSITCAATKQDAEKESAFMCIVAGGLKPIPNGPVAVVTYTVTKGARLGVATIRIDHALGAASDAKKIEIDEANGPIKVE